MKVIIRQSLLVWSYAFITICLTENIIDDYEDAIRQQINLSLHYKFPTNSFKYKPKLDGIMDYGTYGFIIIGSGSSGSVLANRLSEIEGWDVLLLEAGKFQDNISNIPNMAYSFAFSDLNWAYKSTPQTKACLDMVDKRCHYPRGKGIGGSTLINGLVYSRCNKMDFNKWSQKGNPGWSYNEVLPYFKKTENFEENDRDVVVDYEYHHSGGPLNVEYHLPRHPEINTWLEANEEIGYKIVDYNGKEQIGASPTQLNVMHGERVHAANAFINPVKHRRNLKILTESYVIQIIFDNSQVATGVKFVRRGQTYIVKTSKEVILSAGAIASPQLLMLSGIGPAKHLNKVGIKVIKDLEVGSTLRDHPTFFGLNFDTNHTKIEKSLKQYLLEYFDGYGSLTSPVDNEGLGFYQTKYEKEPNYPDLEIMMIPIYGFLDSLYKRLSSAKEVVWQNLDNTRSFTMYITGLHSKSIGTVRLKNNDPFEYPLIDSKFLSDPENIDINTLYEGIQLALKLVNTRAFKRINATLVKQKLPSCQDKPYLTKSYWYCALKYFTCNLYHPMGTCPMGPNPHAGAVVDSEARVHGIKKLRVVDASIFPFALSGHPNAPCVMIAEMVSDIIKLQYYKHKPY